MLAKELIERLKELGEERLIILNDDGNTYLIEARHFIRWMDEDTLDPEDNPICLNLGAVLNKEDNKDLKKGRLNPWDHVCNTPFPPA